MNKKGIRVAGKGKWKKREVGKSDMKSERMKLESSRRSWKARAEVGMFRLKLESTTEVGNFGTFKLSNNSQNFSTAAKLSNFRRNFARFFPTLLDSLQFYYALSKYTYLIKNCNRYVLTRSISPFATLTFDLGWLMWF